jgi:hypothetical protein
VLVPYSTCQVVAVPFGLTLPETVAVVGPTAVTGPVDAVGAVAAAADPAPTRATAAARAMSGLNIVRSFYPSADGSPTPRGDALQSFYRRS